MSYWKNRQEQLKKQMEKDEAALKKRLSSFYDIESKKLERLIAYYFQQYGKDNVIEYRRLMETLSDEDRNLLIKQMDEFADKYPQYEHLMPIRESIYKLDRLEGLEYSIKMQQLEIGAVNNEEITKYLEHLAMDGANIAAETLGFGKNFYSNNPDIAKLFVNVPWSNGKSFSDRIWGDANKLANYLNTDIAQGFARGDSYEKLVKHIRSRFEKVSRNDAYRLIYTEGTYVMAESTMQPFKEDFEKYRISIVEDGKACSVCKGLSEKVFLISERRPGTNFPPLHPWCRCTFEIVVEDWDAWMDEYVKKHGAGQEKKVSDRLRETPGATNAKRNTGATVHYNKNYDYSIKLEGYSEEVNKGMSAAAEKVAQLGEKDRCEHMYLVNLEDGNLEYYETNGLPDSVGYDFWEELDNNPDKQYAFVHNHNTDGMFSETDMRTLLGTEQIPVMAAVRNDAVIYVAERSGEPLASTFFDDLYQNEIDVLNDQLKNGKITAGERAVKREKLIVENLLRDYTKGGGLIEQNGRKE